MDYDQKEIKEHLKVTPFHVFDFDSKVKHLRDYKDINV